jgi:putative tryptophan/tyrosine transport system substrate-binding protein
MLEFLAMTRDHRRFVGTNRRTVLAGIAATLAPRPTVAQAQRVGMGRLGVLMGPLANDPQGRADAAALVRGLEALNWKEGGNLRIDWRWAGGDPALYDRYAAELVARDADVILAFGSTSVAALRRLASTIPIVFVSIIDPVGQGLATNLAHPGGSITGFSNYDPPMAGKWLSMLTQIAPPVARAAVLYNPTTTPYAGLMLRAFEAAAPSLALAVRAAPVHDDAEIETAMTGIAREERAGLVVPPSVFATVHRDVVVALAARHRLPAVYPWPFFVAAGGLMSYGTDQSDLFQRAASYVDRILKGEKPGDLPVQRPTKFVVVINLKTAKALGVTIAPALLDSADEVIE